MTDQVIRLIYPKALLRDPVINRLLRRYDLTVNILLAHIGDGGRWMEVRLSGNPMVIDEAISWLKSQGIEIEY